MSIKLANFPGDPEWQNANFRLKLLKRVQVKSQSFTNSQIRHVEEKLNPLNLAWHTIVFTECDHFNYSLDEQLELSDKKKTAKAQP